jgi:hypothetical protein
MARGAYHYFLLYPSHIRVINSISNETVFEEALALVCVYNYY